ncbi:MAG: PilZ domain-containing protein [Pyrinomonadaceae bacterium]
MQIIERRKGGDRRRHSRYRVSFDVEWEGPSGRFGGTINDISRTGCYILTDGDVDDGDRISIDFSLGDLGREAFTAEVANFAFDIGFGVRFTDLSQEQRDSINRYIDRIEGS